MLRLEDAKAAYFHEDTLLHTRLNFFLVAQAIFFAALSTTWDRENSETLTRFVLWAGLVLSALLGYTICTLCKRVSCFQKLYEGFDKRNPYKRYGFAQSAARERRAVRRWRDLARSEKMLRVWDCIWEFFFRKIWGFLFRKRKRKDRYLSTMDIFRILPILFTLGWLYLIVRF